MGRLFFLVVIVLLVYVLIKSLRAQTLKNNIPPSAKVAENMVRCAHCGVHLPKGESVQSAGKFFCSQAHLNAHHS